MGGVGEELSEVLGDFLEDSVVEPIFQILPLTKGQVSPLQHLLGILDPFINIIFEFLWSNIREYFLPYQMKCFLFGVGVMPFIADPPLLLFKPPPTFLRVTTFSSM